MSVENEDIEQIEFERLLADKRHREVSYLLKSINTALSKDDDDREIIAAINKQGNNFGELIKAIKSIPQSELPEVNVTLNPKEFVSSINKICEDIIASNNKVIETLNTRLLPHSFILVKGYGGVTESVNVLYKQANLIKNKN